MLALMENDGLIRTLRFGPKSLPDDLDKLHDYLRMIGEHLAERAHDHELTWALACQAASETDVLLDLEQQVAMKAAALRARSLRDVSTKLAIWDRLAGEGGEGDETCAALIRSVRRDVDALLIGPGGATDRIN
ncbi:hypothetical protein [Rhodobacteraceae bacterium DSL-40]|uniref:hypothetical protein n=1 Tax=Amaricoccus sp. B4 TaxID=3368557 RepID=UPI0013A6BD76